MNGCIMMSTTVSTSQVLPRKSLFNQRCSPVLLLYRSELSLIIDDRTEEAYTKAVTQLFKSLDRLEEGLSKSSTPYLLSAPHVTEADVRLFTTIVRFDPVYVQHFKCNIRDIRSGYPYIHQWLKHLYWVSQSVFYFLLVPFFLSSIAPLLCVSLYVPFLLSYSRNSSIALQLHTDTTK